MTKMALNTEERKDAVFFVGTEVEHTVMRGQKTLFIVGTPSVEKINETIEKIGGVRHLYFGTSQSFKPTEVADWIRWNDLISEFLERDYWVTLDFGVEYAEEIHEEGWTEHHRFIPMISVKLPYLKLFNYNTVVKIDDTTWGHSNPGVWCHRLHDLMDVGVYTKWDDYLGDDVIADE
jgi:hypothetical protein